MARHATEAERLRAHGAAFELALELGCTPKEAEIELRRRARLASIREKQRQIAAMQAHSPAARSAPLPEAPWMMRD